MPEPTEGTSDPGEITRLVQAAQAGDKAAFDEVYRLAYDELRRLARTVRGWRGGATLNTTALLHEAYIKLVPGPSGPVHDREHFFGIAARAMRQVLVDAARRRTSQRRGGGAPMVELNEAVVASTVAADSGSRAVEILELDRALRQLQDWNPRQANVVECRVFAGLSVEETARALGVSTPTVKRDWQTARAWLAHELGHG